MSRKACKSCLQALRCRDLRRKAWSSRRGPARLQCPWQGLLAAVALLLRSWQSRPGEVVVAKLVWAALAPPAPPAKLQRSLMPAGRSLLVSRCRGSNGANLRFCCRCPACPNMGAHLDLRACGKHDTTRMGICDVQAAMHKLANAR